MNNALPVLPAPLIVGEIKRRADVLAIINRYTRLKLSGKQHLGLCPLHSERHPSFYVDAKKKVFYCFGCGAGGDLFRFIMLAEGCDFRRALEIVAKFSGVARESEAAESRRDSKRRAFSSRRRGFPPQAAQRPGYIARLSREPRSRANGQLPPLSVDCAAERAWLAEAAK